MRLFVGNLDEHVTAEDLEKLFRGYGATWATIWRDMKTGESKGFGFVEIPVDWKAELAIDALNWTEYWGKRLRVSKARTNKEWT